MTYIIKHILDSMMSRHEFTQDLNVLHSPIINNNCQACTNPSFLL